MLFVYYPKCSTCLKAKKFLDDAGIEYTGRHIKEENPTEEEIKEALSGNYCRCISHYHVIEAVEEAAGTGKTAEEKWEDFR